MRKSINVIYIVLIFILDLLIFLLLINLVGFNNVYGFIFLVLLSFKFYYYASSYFKLKNFYLTFLLLVLGISIINVVIIITGCGVSGKLFLILFLLKCIIISFVFSLRLYYNYLSPEFNVDSVDSSKDIVLYSIKPKPAPKPKLLPEFNVDIEDFPKSIELYCGRRYMRGHWHYSIPFKYFKVGKSVLIEYLRFRVLDLDIKSKRCIKVEDGFYLEHKEMEGYTFENCDLLQYSYNRHQDFVGNMGISEFYNRNEKCWTHGPISEEFNKSKRPVCRCHVNKIYLESKAFNNSNLRDFLLKYIMWLNKTIPVKIISIHLFYDVSHTLKLFVEYSYSLDLDFSIFSLLPDMPPVVGVFLGSGYGSSYVSGVGCLCNNVEYKLVPPVITEVKDIVVHYKSFPHLTLVDSLNSVPSVRVVFLTWPPYVRRCKPSKR